MDRIYENIEEYNSNKEHNALINFHDVIADMLSNIKLNLIGTKLFIKCRKLNIFVIFITQCYLAVPKILG